MNFQEKCAWACLLGIVIVFVPYFVVVFMYPMEFVGIFLSGVVILVVFLTAFHIVAAIASPSIRKTGVPPLDELDRWIELRAARISGIVLGVAVLAWYLAAVFGIPLIGVREQARAATADATDASILHLTIPLNYLMYAIHILFAGFVMANIAYYGFIVVAYRRLANG